MFIFRALVAALGLAAVCGIAQATECSGTSVDLRAPGVQLRFAVEIADTAVERSEGLMFRASMPQFSGMLFVYETPHDAAFWMKNTLIPLDIIFFNQAGIVTTIVENAEPQTTISRPGGPGVQFVLEINGGLSKRLGLKPGAELHHPAVDPQLAAWPCAR